MRKSLLVLFVLLFSVFSAYSQSSINIFGGYGQSDFDLEVEEGEEGTQAGYVPVGVQLLFGNQLQFGGEFHYAVVPFTFEFETGGTKIGDLIVNQMFAGGLVRFHLGTGDFKPFVRGGGGVYMGDMEFEYTDEFQDVAEDETIDMKSAFGFNVGGGVVSKMGDKNAFFGEFVYHIVDREPDVEDSEANKANNWAVQVGFQIGIN